MIAITSRIAYNDVQPHLRPLQSEVLEAIHYWRGEDGPSIAELAQHLRRKESSICGRINELRDLGLVKDAPLKPGACGVQVKTYRLAIPKTADGYQPPFSSQLSPE